MGPNFISIAPTAGFIPMAVRQTAGFAAGATTNRRRRRTTPAEEPAAQILDDPLQGFDQVEDDRNELDIFALMKTLTPKEQESMMLYIYRQEPAIVNDSARGKYIEKVVPPVDEDYLKLNHGGGRYLLWLKDSATNQTVRKSSVAIDGPAKLQPGNTVIDGATGQVVQPGAQPSAAAQPTGIEGAMKVVLEHLDKQSAKNGTTDQALAAAMEAMKQGMMGAITMISTAAQQTATSKTGNPLGDELMKRAIDQLVTPRNPLDDFAAVLKTMNELKGTMEPAQPPQPRRNSGIVEEIKGIAELLKGDDEQGTLRDLIFGRRERDEPESLGVSLVKFGMAAIERQPAILDAFAGVLQRFAAPAAPPATMGNAPAQPAIKPARPAAPPAQPAAADGGQQQVINAILQAIVNSFRYGYTGDDAAFALKVQFDPVIPQLQQMLAVPQDQILTWLRTQPIIAPILNEPEFPQFFTELIGGILDTGEGEGEPQPAAAQPAAAEAAQS